MSQKDFFFLLFLGSVISFIFFASESAVKFTKECSFNDVNKITSEFMNKDCKMNKWTFEKKPIFGNLAVLSKTANQKILKFNKG